MKTVLFTIALFISIGINAQNFTGKATYKTSQKSTFKIKDDNNGMDEKMQEEMQKRIQKMNQKTFILEFDKTTSVYKQEAKLEQPKKQAGKSVRVFSFGGSGAKDIFYKDIKENRFSEQTEIMGKAFLVKDELPKIDWELSAETKNIGTYTCYKATFSEETESITISIINGEKVEKKEKKTIVTTAWYTPQIPVSNGPDDYQGLPGLILEINDGKKLMVCTEIVLNPKEKITLVEPTKGKVVNQKKFNKIQKEKSDELMDKMNSRNGIDLGNGINIKMGGK